MGANQVTLRGRFVEIRALASSSRGVDGSTGNGTLFYLSNEPKKARFRLGLPELGLGPPQLNGFTAVYALRGPSVRFSLATVSAGPRRVRPRARCDERV